MMRLVDGSDHIVWFAFWGAAGWEPFTSPAAMTINSKRTSPSNS